MDLSLLGTLKHAQIAAIEWNREVIARVKVGAGAGMQGACLTFFSHVYTPSSKMRMCSTTTGQRLCSALPIEHAGNRRATGLTPT